MYKPASESARWLPAPPALRDREPAFLSDGRRGRTKRARPHAPSSKDARSLTRPLGAAPRPRPRGCSPQTACSCPQAPEAFRPPCASGEEPQFGRKRPLLLGAVPPGVGAAGRARGVGRDGPIPRRPRPQSSVSGWTPRMACSSSGVKPSRFCRSHTKRYT